MRIRLRVRAARQDCRDVTPDGHNAYAYAYAYAYANTNTDTDTNTDANSYAYADTNAYAGPRRGEVDSDCDQGLDLGQRLLPQLQDRQLRWQVVDQLEADLHVA